MEEMIILFRVQFRHSKGTTEWSHETARTVSPSGDSKCV